MEYSRTRALLRVEGRTDRRVRNPRPGHGVFNGPCVEYGQTRPSPVSRRCAAWSPQGLRAQEDAARYLMAPLRHTRRRERLLRTGVLMLAVVLLSPVNVLLT